MKGVMELDSTKASHPIITKVDSPNQITELFDTITYSKGEEFSAHPRTIGFVGGLSQVISIARIFYEVDSKVAFL